MHGSATKGSTPLCFLKHHGCELNVPGEGESSRSRQRQWYWGKGWKGLLPRPSPLGRSMQKWHKAPQKAAHNCRLTQTVTRVQNLEGNHSDSREQKWQKQILWEIYLLHAVLTDRFLPCLFRTASGLSPACAKPSVYTCFLILLYPARLFLSSPPPSLLSISIFLSICPPNKPASRKRNELEM